MKTFKFRHGKAALASALAAGLIVASTPLAQSEEDRITTEQTSTQQASATAVTAEQSGTPTTEVDESQGTEPEPSTDAAIEPVNNGDGADSTAAVSVATESAPSATANPDAALTDAALTDSAPSATADPGAAPIDAGAAERSAAVGPKADFKLETVEVADGVATVKVSGTIVDETGLNKPMESLMLHKRGNKAQVSEVVSATYDGEEAFGDVFDFQPKELKDTFGVSDEDAQFPQVLRISLEPTQGGDAKASLVGKKFSATYKVPAEDKNTQWVLLATDAAFLPEFTVDSGSAETVVQGDGQPEADISFKTLYGPHRGRLTMRLEATLKDVEGLKKDPIELYFLWEGDPDAEITVGSRPSLDRFDPTAPYYKRAGQKFNPTFYSNKYSAERMQMFGIPASQAKESRVIRVVVDMQNGTNAPVVNDEVAFTYTVVDNAANKSAGWKLLAFEPPTVESAELPPLQGYLDSDFDNSNDYLQDLDNPANFLKNIETSLETATKVFNARRSNTDPGLADMTHHSEFLTNLPKPKRHDTFVASGKYPTKGWDRAEERLDENGYIYNYLWCADRYGIASPHDDDPGLSGGFRELRRSVVREKRLAFQQGDCQQYADGEQGRFFSRGHVQRIEGIRGNHVIRSESFTIGGPDGGAWYGGDFGVFSSSSAARPLESDQVTAETALRIQIKGILDTKNWKFERLASSGGVEQYLLVHPTKEFGLMVQSNSSGLLYLHFLNLEGMNNFARVDSGSDGRAYRFGVKIPPNTPIKISYGSRETGRPENNFDTVSLSRSRFVPFYAAPAPVQPELKIEKDIVTQNPDVIDDLREIEYTIAVSNKSQGATDVRFRLTDTPGLPEGVDIQKVVVVDDKVSPAKEYVLEKDPTADPTNGDRYLVDRRKLPAKMWFSNPAYMQNDEFFYIPAGESYNFKIKVYTDGKSQNVAQGDTVCDGTPEHGAFNIAAVEAPGIDPVKDSACANIPTPPVPSIVKDFVKFQQVPQSPELQEAVYMIVVDNSKAGSIERNVKLTDSPSFPDDAVVQRVRVKFDDNLEGPAQEEDVTVNPEQAFTLKDNLVVPAGSAVTAFVTVTFTQPGPYPENDSHLSELVCAQKSAANKLKQGAFNVASISVDGEDISDDACENITPRVKLDTSLIVRKLGTNGVIPFGQGWEFKLFAVDDQWQPQGQAIEFGQDAAGDGRSTADHAVTEGNYLLVETRAPQGYQLLAQPVKLEVYQDGAQLKVRQPQGVSNPAAEVSEPNIVSISDVTTGDMPKSGGMGVFWLLLAGLALLGAAWWFNRKRES